MEAIIFCGIQASGKSTFYKEYFFQSHMRVSMDLLHTRNKEDHFLRTCFTTRQRFVVDNTNPTRKERQKYIEVAKAHKCKVIGYFFDTEVSSAIERNLKRKHKENIPTAGIRATFKRLQVPEYEEGFDELYRVEIRDGGFEVFKM
jgi:predicted kinase